MTVEEFFKQCNSKELDKFDKKASKFTYYDLLEFAEQYHRKQLQLGVVSNSVCEHPYAFLRGEEHGNAECTRCGKKLE